ncbi:Myosin IB heavy chain, partial [Mucuna pruriens]
STESSNRQGGVQVFRTSTCSYLTLSHHCQQYLPYSPPLRFPLPPSSIQRLRMPRRVHIEDPKYDDVPEESIRFKSSNSNVSDDQEPFMGIKVRRKASLHRDYKGDYIHVASHPFLMKILHKQGDNEILFADRVLKFTSSGKMKRCVLMITDLAIYVVDPDVDALKRRIALPALERICLSELSDNFFAVIVPSEYDLLMASTRKTEIVTVLAEATKSKSASGFELDVVFSNRFEYNAASDLVKEVQFEEVED